MKSFTLYRTLFDNSHKKKLAKKVSKSISFTLDRDLQFFFKKKHKFLPEELAVLVPEYRMKDRGMTIKEVAVKLNINFVLLDHWFFRRHVKFH